MPQLPTWITGLDEADLQFLKRFMLESGSLKAVAGQYNISYPTVRARLDRLIAKIRAADDAAGASPFIRRIRILVADGKLAPEDARSLLEAHNGEINEMQKGACDA